jgi:signal transduction histidine kinase/CheY-like chemotaxis protein
METFQKQRTTNEKRKKLITAIGTMLLLAIMGKFIYDSYIIYKSTIVGQQQEQLLTISKNLSKFLEIYFQQNIDNLAIIDKSNNLSRELLEQRPINGEVLFQEGMAPLYESSDMIAVYMIDTKGRVLFESTKTGESKNYLQDQVGFLSRVKEFGEEAIGQPYVWEEEGAILPIVHPIYRDEVYQGSLVAVMSLEQIYESFIAPTKVGEQGYVMVKDENGAIIMHPVKAQIGIRIVEDRRARFPEFYFEDLEQLEISQYTEKEGVAEYYSYWWTQEVPTKVKKISAFSRVELGETFWVLAVVMDYSEIAGPIQNNLIRLINLAFIVCFIILTASVSLAILRKRQEDLLIETKYLKNMNFTLKELQDSEKKLMHYQKLQTIGTLTGGIAHELNNLLTPILGYSQLAVQMMPKEHEYYEDMEEIYEASLKAKELMEQISLLSRREKAEGKYTFVDLSEEITKGIKMVKIVKDEHIDLILQIQPECGYIQGSKTHIHQILINLCNNACQAMKENGGVLTISLQKLEKEDAAYALLTVQDTGCGMDEEIIQRIYDPFFTTKDIGEGTGIGLSIVSSMVENYKGKIEVESEKGKGSTFRVFLPVLENKPLVADPQMQCYISQKEINILLVEDDQRIVKLLKKSLTHMGYKLTAQTKPQKALELFKEDPMAYQLLITDYAMPKLTGAKLIEEVKNIRSDIKVILITGLIEEEVVQQIKQQIIDDFVLKPLDYNELAAKIHKLFD